MEASTEKKDVQELLALVEEIFKRRGLTSQSARWSGMPFLLPTSTARAQATDLEMFSDAL